MLGLLAFSTQRVRDSIPIILCGIAVGGTIFGVYEFQSQKTLASIFGISFSGLSEDAAFSAARQTTEIFRDGVYRSSSFFAHSIVYAQYVGAAAPFSIYLVQHGKGIQRLLGITSLLLLPIALIISGARSGFIVTSISLTIYILIGILGRRLSTRRLLSVLSLAMLVGVVFLAPIQSAIEDLMQGSSASEQASSSARDEMIAKGIYALQERPITGYGHGMSPEVAGLVGRNDIRTIDNFYLSTAVDFGYVGILIFGVFVFSILSKNITAISKSGNFAQIKELHAYTAAIVSIAVGQYILSIPDNINVIFIAASFSSAMIANSTKELVRPKIWRNGSTLGT